MCFGSEWSARQTTETRNEKIYYSSSVMRQAISSFETSVYLHQSKGRPIPEDYSCMIHTHMITNML